MQKITDCLRLSRTRRRVLTGVLGVFFFLVSAINPAKAQTASEYDVKAAFLYKFASYVEWPPRVFSGEDSPVIFAVLDAAEIEDKLQAIVRGRQVQGRAVQIRHLQADDELTGVHVLFIGRSSNADIETLLRDAATKSVLTVTETEAQRYGGSIINFEIVDDKVRFDVSLDPAKQGELKISSRLLQVASRVIGG